MTTTEEMPTTGRREAKPQPQPRPPAPTNDADSYEDAFDASLFLNEEYVSVSVTFGEEVEEGNEEEGNEGEGDDGTEPRSRSRFSLDLFCSQAASTDFDLTGQVLWPAAALLAGYLVAGEGEEGEEEQGGGGERRESSRGRSLTSASTSACELGAGLGLSGLAAVAFSGLRRLVLTDGSDVVLRVLERNAERVKEMLAEKEKEKEGGGGGGEEEKKREVSTFLLHWGDDGAATALLRQHSFGGRGFDLLLGADVTYSLSALPALFSTAAMLLKEEEEEGEGEAKEKKENKNESQKKPAPTFLLSYVSRSKALDRAVPLEAERAGFDVEEVEGTRRRLPGGQEGWILSLTKKAKKV